MENKTLSEKANLEARVIAILRKDPGMPSELIANRCGIKKQQMWRVLAAMKTKGILEGLSATDGNPHIRDWYIKGTAKQ